MKWIEAGILALLGLLVVYIMMPAPADATEQDWYWVNTDINGSEYWVSASSFRPTARGANTWVRGLHRNDRTVRFRMTMIQVDFDCIDSRWRRLHSVIYYPDGQQQVDRIGTWQPIIPESMAAGWAVYVCSAAESVRRGG